jgi:hypothetical protein
MNRYSPLGDLLRFSAAPEVTVGFDELSSALPRGLPASAYARESWWTNDPRHAQCLDGWDGAGYRVVDVSLASRVVTFRATGEPRWEVSDAWVFAALPGSLSDVIAHGDAINHAILSESEFTQAVPRLLTAALIGADHAADRYWHTPAGREFYERHMKGHGLFGWMDVFPPALRRLGPPVDGSFSLAPGEFVRAVRGRRRS